MKRFKNILLVGLISSLFLTACGGGANDPVADPTPTVEDTVKDDPIDNVVDDTDAVYYLNFKPEIAEVYEEIAKEYEAETGKKLRVETAAAGTYEQTLRSEIAKKDAPVLYQINGPVGYEAWKDYTADLRDSELYNMLSDKSLAITSGDGVYGIPYVVEGYGIIYNNDLMDKYFAHADKATRINSMDEIKSFLELSAVVEDMNNLKDSLDIGGVFASTSLNSGEAWRWETHLSNLAFNQEFSENADYDNPILAGLNSKEIEFKYADNFKNVFDLYINNSITEKGLLGSKSVENSMAEFALGQVAMVQNGNWAWSQISDVDGNVVNSEDIKYLPIYSGFTGENNQGLCIGTENYFAINSQASEEKQQAAMDFLVWLYSSETGKKFVVEKLNFIAPFNTFKDDEKPEDPLAKEVIRWMESGAESIPWTFASYPSENFKKYFADALLEYAQENVEWDGVVNEVKSAWSIESQ